MVDRNLPDRRRNCKNACADNVGHKEGLSKTNPQGISDTPTEDQGSHPNGFFVTGNPKAQPRLRATRRGTFVRMYTPNSAKEWQVKVAASAYTKFYSPLSGALDVTLAFYFNRPKSHTTKSGSLKLSAPLEHRFKPDVDNLAKCVLDAMNEIAYTDDSQIQSLVVTKRYVTFANEKEGCWITVQNAK